MIAANFDAYSKILKPTKKNFFDIFWVNQILASESSENKIDLCASFIKCDLRLMKDRKIFERKSVCR